jgi:hypothetical protein
MKEGLELIDHLKKQHWPLSRIGEDRSFYRIVLEDGRKVFFAYYKYEDRYSLTIDDKQVWFTKRQGESLLAAIKENARKRAERKHREREETVRRVIREIQ